MTYQNFRLDLDEDGIAVVTWDMPGKSMNVFDLGVMDELSAIVDAIKANDAIRGIVIASGKEAFSGGADLNMLDRMLGEFRAAVAAGHREEAVQRLYQETFRLGDLFRRIGVEINDGVYETTGAIRTQMVVMQELREARRKGRH